MVGHWMAPGKIERGDIFVAFLGDDVLKDTRRKLIEFCGEPCVVDRADQSASFPGRGYRLREAKSFCHRVFEMTHDFAVGRLGHEAGNPGALFLQPFVGAGQG